MTIYIDLKRWFLIASACVLGWVFGFALYLMIGPKILPVVNTEFSLQQSAMEPPQSPVPTPANTISPHYSPEQGYYQNAVIRKTVPRFKITEMLLVDNGCDVSAIQKAKQNTTAIVISG